MVRIVGFLESLGLPKEHRRILFNRAHNQFEFPLVIIGLFSSTHKFELGEGRDWAV